MKKVLVIEDNHDNMKLISYALQRSGYEIIQASTGEEGVELALREQAAFVIVDIVLPGINGYEVTRRIRSSERIRNMPVVAITSSAMAGDEERILKAGCTAYFEKPIDPLTIVEKIEKAIGL